MSAALPLSLRARQTADQPISYFMRQAVENPSLISLAAGLVDAESLPVDEVNEVLADILSQPATARAALQYGTTQGYTPLREKLLSRTAALDDLKPEEMGLTLDDVLVTTGSQQLLYLVGEALLDPGDIVITEAPSYFVYQGTLTSLGVRTLAVPTDWDGMVTDALEDLLKSLEQRGELGRVRMIYVCDYYQNPTGRTLSLPRRRHLLELAQRYSRDRRILILEDAAYRELHYEGPDLPTVKSFDADNSHVILGMTFSKPCAPGLKTGYGFLPRGLMEPVLRLKGNHDFGSNNLTQHLLDRLLDTGLYEQHVAHLCGVYHNKLKTLNGALLAQFHECEACWPEVQWTRPEGGLYVWLRFPPEVETGPDSELMRAALREGVLYVPGQFCHIPDAAGQVPANEVRLSFGVASPDQLREAVRRLARAANEVRRVPARRPQPVGR